ncbi:MAG: hypothetical protein HY560_13895, partial [Gemmatimonadetes bacterium]|nr:hypothetical protein [Gemmatimonadota bacterium]
MTQRRGVSVPVKCGFDERDFRMQADPETFFTTDHYRGYPTVFIRLPRVRVADLRAGFEQVWRCARRSASWRTTIGGAPPPPPTGRKPAATPGSTSGPR